MNLLRFEEVQKLRVELSIIIPVYNGEKTIIDTLESIILQGEEDYEVLIIDDGSTDNTSNVVKKFIESNKRFNYYYQKIKVFQCLEIMG